MERKISLGSQQRSPSEDLFEGQSPVIDPRLNLFPNNEVRRAAQAIDDALIASIEALAGERLSR